jgi:hypothetical protein
MWVSWINSAHLDSARPRFPEKFSANLSSSLRPLRYRFYGQGGVHGRREGNIFNAEDAEERRGPQREARRCGSRGSTQRTSTGEVLCAPLFFSAAAALKA